ncbi:iron ABC transporter permease, partial [Staphylococcus epidermidis]
MQMSANKKISILVVMAICMAIFYLLVGLDFDIF